MIYYMAWCIDLKDILRWIITFGTTLVSGLIVMGATDFAIMEEEIKKFGVAKTQTPEEYYNEEIRRARISAMSHC